MKRLLLGLATCVAITFSTQAQSSQMLPKTTLNGNEVFDTLSLDQFEYFKHAIDGMGITELKKYRESYIYRRRMNPCAQNKEIVLFIENKIKQLQ